MFREYTNACWERHLILKNVRNSLAEIGSTLSSDLNETRRSSLDKCCKNWLCSCIDYSIQVENNDDPYQLVYEFQRLVQYTKVKQKTPDYLIISPIHQCRSVCLRPSMARLLQVAKILFYLTKQRIKDSYTIWTRGTQDSSEL